MHSQTRGSVAVEGVCPEKKLEELQLYLFIKSYGGSARQFGLSRAAVAWQGKVGWEIPFWESLSSTARSEAILDEVEEDVKAALVALRSRAGAAPFTATSVILCGGWCSRAHGAAAKREKEEGNGTADSRITEGSS